MSISSSRSARGAGAAFTIGACFVSACAVVGLKLSLDALEDAGLRADVEPLARSYAWHLGGLDGATREEKPVVIDASTERAGWPGAPRAYVFVLEGIDRRTGKPGRIRIEWSVARHDWTRLK